MFNVNVKCFSFQCSHRTRIAAFAKYGHVTEVMKFLNQTLESSEMSSDDKQHLSGLMLHCYMHQIMAQHGETIEIDKFRY